MLASALDPDGRLVELTEERWQHITIGHPELRVHLRDVMEAVRTPDRRLRGRQGSEEWFYREGAGPSRWLKAVVHYEQGKRAHHHSVRPKIDAMTVTVGQITFDNVSYDRDADVLYLSVGDPSVAVNFEESAEGHSLRYDAEGRLVGITIVNARASLEKNGAIIVSPPQLRVEAEGLAEALAAA
jgi:uncharacterized protein YuzE